MTNAIYETKGKAREYCELAVNLYDGCGHGCTYCYNVAQTGKWKKSDFSNPNPRAGILEALSRDAYKMQKAGDKRPVFLCFTCDPYQPKDTEHQLTRQAIEILHEHDIPVMILTKGGHLAERDLDLLRSGDLLGATLTFVHEHESRKWEPHAAPPMERMMMLWKAHEAGIKTWVSLEPVIDPIQSIELIRETAGYVDHFKVGRWNHDERAEKINWRIFAYEARATLNKLRCDYYLKKDLARYL